MREDQIKRMVDRFLSWKLPENFNPDGGISFKGTHSEHGPWGPQKYLPTGTNLFDSEQATEMVRHMVADDAPEKKFKRSAETSGWPDEVVTDTKDLTDSELADYIEVCGSDFDGMARPFRDAVVRLLRRSTEK